MYKIEHYKIAWNAKKDEGVIVLYTTNKADGVERIQVDSAAESDLIVDILNNEKPVYYQDGLLFTGFEPVGEEVATSNVEKVVAAPATKTKKKSTKTKKKKASGKDKLRLIEGIGPKIEGLLYDAGISTFQGLADANLATLKDILATAGSRYKMHDPTTWGQQAALAAAGKMDELKKWQDELDGGKVK